jgi:hypothetical protein
MLHPFFRANEIYENAIVRDLQLFSEREFAKLLQHYQHISVFCAGQSAGGCRRCHKRDTVKGQTPRSRDAYTRSSAACEVGRSSQLAVRGDMARDVHFKSGENS